MSVPTAPQRNTLAESYLGNARPSLDDELRSLIARFGATAVREATRRLAKGKKGRKQERDWPELSDTLNQDGMDWLEGRDPLALRSNYSIASAFAEKHPGQSRASTHRRIMKKLAARRELFFLLHAWQICEDERPFADYFRAVDAIARVDPRWGNTLMRAADRCRGAIERYRQTRGDPEPNMTIKQIEDALNKPVNALLRLASPPPEPFTLSAMFGRPK